MQIWDTAGQEKYHSIGFPFYKGSDCCAICYDLSSKVSFEHITQWKDNFIHHTGTNVQEFPFVVIGNKSDLECEGKRKVSKDEVNQWCKANGDIPHFETSALTNSNVDEAFLSMIRRALELQKEDEI